MEAICQPQGPAGAPPGRGRLHRAHAGNGRAAQLPARRAEPAPPAAARAARRADHAQPARYRDRAGRRPAGGHAADRAYRHLSNKVGSLWSYIPGCRTASPRSATTCASTLINGRTRRPHIATVYSPIVLPPPIEHSTLRGELGLAADDIVVGCVAVMRATKGTANSSTPCGR